MAMFMPVPEEPGTLQVVSAVGLVLLQRYLPGFVEGAVISLPLSPLEQCLVPEHGWGRVIEAMDIVMVHGDIGELLRIIIHIDPAGSQCIT